MTTISDDKLRATINPYGAELHSLTTNKGHNILWSREASVWPKSAPILFPIVGELKNGQYTFNGQTYTMPKHGLVRGETWEVIETSASLATFRIKSTESTLKQYPFHWELSATFKLEQSSLSVSYTV